MDAEQAAPLPADWEADVVLADGGTVHLRPIRPDDGDRLLAFHLALSEESRYFRFFSPKPRLTDREIERFTHVDHVDRVALVAELGSDLVAVARYDRWPGSNEAEVAFTVADVHQGRGISTLMLEHLAAIGRERGIVTFTAEVLPDNRPMLAVFRRAGFDVHHRLSGGIVDVQFAIEPTRAYLDTVEGREQRAESRSIARLVAPRSIAVIGASERPGTVGHQLFANLLAGGFDGPVYPINPSAPHVLSVPTHPSVLDVVDDIHLALVAVPADAVPEVLDQCAAKRVRGVVVIAAPPSPQGDEDDGVGADSIALQARRNGMRLIGPASMGLIVTGRRGTMHASFAKVPVRAGRVALSSQSGPLGIAMLEAAHRLGIGISTFVSLGTKGDVSANDFLQFWYDDPGTDAVLLYTESFGNPRKFGRVARRVSRAKPIVAVKAGRALVGAVAGDDLAADALYLHSGVVRVQTVAELFDVGRVLSTQPLPAGPDVAVVTNARSPAVLAGDGLVAAGLRPAVLSPATVAALSARLAATVRVENPLDLTHEAMPADYRFALDEVLADPAVHAVMAIYAPPLVGGVDDFARAIDDAAHEGKPLVAVALGRDDGPLVPAHPDGVPAFAFPEPAAAALGRAAQYASWRSRPEGVEPSLPDIDREAAAALVARVLGPGPSGVPLPVDGGASGVPLPVAERPSGVPLPLAETVALLGAYGIAYAPTRRVRTADEAVAAADELGYPVTVKATNIGRRARGESGGVALDLYSAADVGLAYDRMRSALGGAMAEAVVQAMVPAGVEVVLAVESHPAFGPVVTFGLGGAYAEAIADRSARSLPLTDLDAVDLVASSRAAGALEAAGADLASLHDMLCRLGRLADDVPEIAGLRCNPVLASPSGARAVDVIVVLAPVVPTPLDTPVRRL